MVSGLEVGGIGADVPEPASMGAVSNWEPVTVVLVQIGEQLLEILAVRIWILQTDFENASFS